MEDKRLQTLIAERRNILADFLRADLKLGMTFAQVARTEAANGDRPAGTRSDSFKNCRDLYLGEHGEDHQFS